VKLKELPKDTNVQNYCVRLPKKVLKAFKEYAGGEPIMYPVGPVMGYGFMFSPQAPTEKNRRLYPMPETIELKEILNWTIV
jgi:hypothetical protein